MKPASHPHLVSNSFFGSLWSRFLWVSVVAGMLGFAVPARCQKVIVCGITVSASSGVGNDTYIFKGSAGQKLLFAFYWQSLQPGAADIFFPGSATPNETL